MQKRSYLILILMLLSLVIVSADSFAVSTMPRDIIANSIQSVITGGAITSQRFNIQKDEIISGNNFAGGGIDPTWIVFAKDSSLNNTFSAGINDEGNVSYFRYSGVVKATLRAKVFCQATSEAIINLIPEIGETIDTTQVSADVETLCGNNNSQPCCLVVLQRSDSSVASEYYSSPAYFFNLSITIVFYVIIPLVILIGLAFFLRRLFNKYTHNKLAKSIIHFIISLPAIIMFVPIVVSGLLDSGIIPLMSIVIIIFGAPIVLFVVGLLVTYLTKNEALATKILLILSILVLIWYMFLLASVILMVMQSIHLA